jgi:hypothetical protein
MAFKPASGLLSLALLLAAVCTAQAHATAVATVAQRAPRVVTLTSAGKTIILRPGSLALLRLNHQRFRWSAPHADGVALKIEAIDYERDPGFDEWKITTRTPGRARISVTGKACNGCSGPDRVFRFTIVVSRS